MAQSGGIISPFICLHTTDYPVYTCAYIFGAGMFCGYVWREGPRLPYLGTPVLTLRPRDGH